MLNLVGENLLARIGCWDIVGLPAVGGVAVVAEKEVAALYEGGDEEPFGLEIVNLVRLGLPGASLIAAVVVEGSSRTRNRRGAKAVERDFAAVLCHEEGSHEAGGWAVAALGLNMVTEQPHSPPLQQLHRHVKSRDAHDADLHVRSHRFNLRFKSRWQIKAEEHCN